MRGLKRIFAVENSIWNRRIFYRCVDWNLSVIGRNKIHISRIFYRCVDWNWTENVTVQDGRNVASFTDAWIETILCVILTIRHQSHLLQMRGLKLYQGNWDICIRRRIFYRCVDWNIVYINLSTWFFVASFTDAWIETDNAIKMSGLEVVASFTDAWIETRHWDIRTLRI